MWLEQDVQNIYHKITGKADQVATKAATAFHQSMDAVTNAEQRTVTELKHIKNNLPKGFHDTNARIEWAAKQAFHTTNHIIGSAISKGAHEIGAATGHVANSIFSGLFSFWQDLSPTIKIVVAIMAVLAIQLTIKGGKTGLSYFNSGFEYVKQNPKILATPFLL